MESSEHSLFGQVLHKEDMKAPLNLPPHPKVSRGEQYERAGDVNTRDNPTVFPTVHSIKHPTNASRMVSLFHTYRSPGL